MKERDSAHPRRRFLKAAAISTGAILLPRVEVFGAPQPLRSATQTNESKSADYTLRIRVSPVEIALPHSKWLIPNDRPRAARFTSEQLPKMLQNFSR